MKTLKFLLKSLFSNGVIIKEGRKQKWWLTFVILLLSIVISLIPMMVSTLTANGRAMITNYQDRNVDYALERLSYEYLNGDNAKVVLKIVDGKMVMEEGKTFSDVEEHKTVKIEGDEEVSYIEVGRDGDPILLAAYVDYSIQNNPSYNKVGDKVSDVLNQLAVAYKTADEKDDEGYYKSRLINTLIFASESFYFTTYDNTATVKYLVGSDGKLNFKDKGESSSYTGTYGSIESRNSNLTTFFNASSSNQTVERWKTFFDQSYEPQKMTNFLMYLLIYSSLNVLVLLVMSLTIVIMSRFKSAQCGKIGFGGALKLVIFATLCPSIISMLVGFIFSQIQSISFLMVVGFRCIFLSTRLTRGEPIEAPEKNKKPQIQKK